MRLVIQTICVTGIRASELRLITVEAIRGDEAEITNKQKQWRCASPIRGGYVVWQEDVAELSQLIEKLRIVGSELQEGVEFLQSEMEVKSKRQRIDEQNRLYELTVRQTMHQLETIKAHFAKAKQADEAGKRRLLHEMNL